MKFTCIALISAISAIQIEESVTWKHHHKGNRHHGKSHHHTHKKPPVPAGPTPAQCSVIEVLNTDKTGSKCTTDSDCTGARACITETNLCQGQTNCPNVVNSSWVDECGISQAQSDIKYA